STFIEGGLHMYLDTANINEITEAFSLGIMKGVTTNPSILLTEGKPRKWIIKEILDKTDGTVFVQTVGETYEEMYNDCQEIRTYDQTKIGIKIPATFEGLKVIMQLKNMLNKPLTASSLEKFNEDGELLNEGTRG
ncbi:transaldolase family protein, partial [Heyndrickxia sporothermodurans]